MNKSFENMVLAIAKLYKILFTLNTKTINPINRFVSFISICIFISLCFYKTESFGYVKTIFNCLLFNNQSEYILALAVLSLVCLSYILLKLLYEILIILISFKFSNLKLVLYKFSFLACICISIYIFFNCTMNKAKEQFSLEIQQIVKIENILNGAKVPHTSYVSKIPYLFNDKIIVSEPDNFIYETIALKQDEKNIAIVKASQPYHFLIAQGYKYHKISNKLGVFAKDPLIIDTLSKNNFKFYNYYYTETLNLPSFANKNRLKYISNKGILLNSKNEIVKNREKKYLLKGMYKIYLAINFENIDALSSNDIGNFRLTASDQSITLFSTPIKYSESKKGIHSYEYLLNLEHNYHDVELLFSNLTNYSKIFLSGIKIEKLPTND